MESDGGDTCVNFTPSQYITIYHSRLQTRDSDQLDAMCLLQMRTRNWQDKILPGHLTIWCMVASHFYVSIEGSKTKKFCLRDFKILQDFLKIPRFPQDFKIS